MISIERSYFSYDLSTLFIHFSSSDVGEAPLSSMTKLDLVKNVDGVDLVFSVEINQMASDSPNEIYSINLDSDVSSEDLSFDHLGIIEIRAEFESGNTTGYVAMVDQFYDMKAKMMSVNCDNSNISKMSKKLTTFAFLEKMLLSSMENKFIDDARVFYKEMIKLSSFGHSNIYQKTPNCNY